VVEEAMIRRRRTEDLSHSEHLTVSIAKVAWRLRRSLPDHAIGDAMVSAQLTGFTLHRTINTNRQALLFMHALQLLLACIADAKLNSLTLFSTAAGYRTEALGKPVGMKD
jgi:hypothetical protein